MRLTVFFRRPTLTCALALSAALIMPGAWAKSTSPRAAPHQPTLERSAQAEVIYRTLNAEILLRLGQREQAFDLLFDVARRSNDPEAYRRAFEVAIRSGSETKAERVLNAWQLQSPREIEVRQKQTQLYLLSNQTNKAQAPLTLWLQQTQGTDRVALLQALPRLLGMSKQRDQANLVLTHVLQPYRPTSTTRLSGHSATIAEGVAAEMTWISWNSQGQDPEKTLAALSALTQIYPNQPSPAIAALELMRSHEDAEALVLNTLKQSWPTEARPTEAEVRQAYAVVLAKQQRFFDVKTQLETVTQLSPNLRSVLLSLAAAAIETHHYDQAQSALERFLNDQLPWTDTLQDDERDRAYLLMAQVKQEQGRLDEVATWLDKVQDSDLQGNVALRRAITLTLSNQWPQAQRVLQEISASEPAADKIPDFIALQLQVLSELKRWNAAVAVVDQALQNQKPTAELLYQKAMFLDRQGGQDTVMDGLLEQALKLNPKHGGSLNALGYGWADRNMRLPEARRMIEAALELTPGDPFIQDSLGWVAFRQGQTSEALLWLKKAWLQRHDAEIGAHLGEVLWVSGQQDQARKIWAEAVRKDPSAKMLQNTLIRFGVNTKALP